MRSVIKAIGKQGRQNGFESSYSTYLPFSPYVCFNYGCLGHKMTSSQSAIVCVMMIAHSTNKQEYKQNLLWSSILEADCILIGSIRLSAMSTL